MFTWEGIPKCTTYDTAWDDSPFLDAQLPANGISCIELISLSIQNSIKDLCYRIYCALELGIEAQLQYVAMHHKNRNPSIDAFTGPAIWH
jgi:hypothetical protein